MQTEHAKKLEQLQFDKENLSRQYESLREVIDSKRERVKELARSRVERASMPRNSTLAQGSSTSPPARATALSRFFTRTPRTNTLWWKPSRRYLARAQWLWTAKRAALTFPQRSSDQFRLRPRKCRVPELRCCPELLAYW